MSKATKVLERPHRTKPATPTALLFPPWGVHVSKYAAELLSPRIPADWCPSQVNSAQRRVEWDKTCDDILSVLNEHLWPQFDNDTWSGAAARRMEELTRNDFEVMEHLLPRLDDPVRSPVANRASGPAHSTLFDIEDVKGFGNSFGTYGDELASAVKAVSPLDDVVMWSNLRILAKAGSIDLQLKAHLQRPRAYQMVLRFGCPGYRHRVALSANTPSMISGHCLHGMLAGMAINEVLVRAGLASGPAIGALQQYAADLGDRRVFGGVHYPSDNISSWYTASRLAAECFEDGREARRFLRAAVKQSTVAAAIAAYAIDNPQSALAGAWRWVQRQLQAS